MRAQRILGVLTVAIIINTIASGIHPAAQTPTTFKVAFYNVQSGKGEIPLPGRSCVFTENTNCTDPSQPLNAWGKGVMQAELKAKLGGDPTIVALGVAEAWTCATPAAIQQALGWAARSSARNGVAIIARYGFAGPEQWLQLDTSLNENPADTMWVLKVPVCLDSGCTESVVTFTAHWFGRTTVDADSYTAYARQAEQTIEFIDALPASQPRVMIGDLNVFEDTQVVCMQFPLNEPVQMLRDAGYVDAWNAIHGLATGYTGMWNRPGCGSPEGNLWKRLDFAWSKQLHPLSMTRFGMVTPGNCAPSDHAGILVEYQRPSVAGNTLPPQISLQSPSANSTVSGTIPLSAAASDDRGVARVELLVDGVARHVDTAAPYTFNWDTRLAVNGSHTIEAAATDVEGNRTLSVPRTVVVDNKGGAGEELVLHARDATAIAGNWSLVSDASAAGGRALHNPDQGLARQTTALPSPRDYVELTFTAKAGIPYRIWIRGHAQGNDVANDSVHVQFSNSVTSSGSAIYRIGTSSSTIVALEDCAGCLLSGWGWQDNASGGRDVLGPPIYFGATGTQRIRIQRREDGIRFDQVVLSAVAYVHAPPGPPANDTTILPPNNGGTAPPPPPPPPPPSGSGEVVLYAAHASAVSGNWSLVSDSTAAGGQRLQNANAGAAKLSTALASPAHYVELAFTASAGTPYHLWIRGKALNNHYTNDSVFVQFDDSVTQSGQPQWRIGTSSATIYVLEECSGCAIGNWGWEDNGYGKGVLGAPVYFATSGTHRMRIQVREDGLGIDQVVLSPAKYLTTPPGPPRSDSTILPASGGGTAPPPPPPPPPPGNGGEVVLHAADAGTVRGNWSVVSDSTAAGGQRLQNPNAGAAKLGTALASPAHYFELTFNADAGTPYRLWIRGKALNNHYTNDSVFVQFDNSVTQSGQAQWRIGTSSATVYVLEECSGCAISSWGWEDNGYGKGVLGAPVYFATSGTHRMRIQVREDGLGIDQVVLSPAKYLTTPPGPPRSDSTILPAAGGGTASAPPPPPGNGGEVVLHAADAGTVRGNWSVVSDSTAAGGQRLQNPNAGAAKLGTAHASPAHYFGLTFNAEAGTPYRLWIRGKAQNNHYTNDSVFVQFDNSVTQSGQAQWRIGTSSATVYVLEECSGCALSSWGWEDNGYGRGVSGPLVYFATTGAQRIRIQVREDGLGIDQVVLSPAEYLTAPPGPPRNDGRILPASGG